MKECNRCGLRNADNAFACSRCGQILSTNTNMNMQTQLYQQEHTDYYNTQPYTEYNPLQNNSFDIYDNSNTVNGNLFNQQNPMYNNMYQQNSSGAGCNTEYGYYNQNQDSGYVQESQYIYNNNQSNNIDANIKTKKPINIVIVIILILLFVIISIVGAFIGIKFIKSIKNNEDSVVEYYDLKNYQDITQYVLSNDNITITTNLSNTQFSTDGKTMILDFKVNSTSEIYYMTVDNVKINGDAYEHIVYFDDNTLKVELNEVPDIINSVSMIFMINNSVNDVLVHDNMLTTSEMTINNFDTTSPLISEAYILDKSLSLDDITSSNNIESTDNESVDKGDYSNTIFGNEKVGYINLPNSHWNQLSTGDAKTVIQFTDSKLTVTLDFIPNGDTADSVESISDFLKSKDADVTNIKINNGEALYSTIDSNQKIIVACLHTQGGLGYIAVESSNYAESEFKNIAIEIVESYNPPM